ncbi:hypothetical protein EDM27_17440, partial [Staphylococcus aureus]
MIKFEETSELHDLAFLLLVYPLSEIEMFYTCILDMIKFEETSELHDLAFLLLVYPLSEIE